MKMGRRAVAALAARDAEVHQQIGMRRSALQRALVSRDGSGHLAAQREQVAEVERGRRIRGILRRRAAQQFDGVVLAPGGERGLRLAQQSVSGRGHRG